MTATLGAGFVGLGRMGLPMARHAAKAGFPVTGYDIDAAALARCPGDGASSAKAVAAAADVVLVIVPTDEDTVAACLGPDGALAAARPETVVVLCGSLLPETVRRIGAAGGPAGILDVPLTKGVRAAESGDMTLLVGGETRHLERARPILQSFSTAIHHLGPLGSGQIGKTVNNILLWVNLKAALEALDLGRRLGIAPAAPRRALYDCSADSWVLRELDRIQPTWPGKDLDNAMTLAGTVGLSMPLAERTAAAWPSRDQIDKILASERNGTSP